MSKFREERIGLQTLVLADCLEYLPKVAAGTISVAVTDPPYILAAGSTMHAAGKSGGWADMMNASYWFAAWYREVWRALAEDGAFWTFLNWRTVPVVMKAAMDANMPTTSLLVWDKQWIGPGGHQGLRPSYELVCLLAKPGYQVSDRGTPDIWQELWSAHKPTGHPAEKPEALVRRIIECGNRSTERVLDPFMGSGTALVSAERLGFSGVGIEQDSAYFDIACRRVEAAAAQPRLDFDPPARREDLLTLEVTDG